MSKSKNSKKSVVRNLFNRRENDHPGEDAKLADIAATLEEISRQVQKEARETILKNDEIFSPVYEQKAEAASRAKAKGNEAAAGKKVKAVRRNHLTPDQYENIIENSLSVLEVANQIIDRNRAITSKLKTTPT